MKLQDCFGTSDNESATMLTSIQPFELPPPALTPDYEHSERRLSTDLLSDSLSTSSDGMSESLISSSGKHYSYYFDEFWSMNPYLYINIEKYSTESNDLHSATEENSINMQNLQESEEQEDGYSFKLPPAALFSNQDEILRPSLFRKGSSWDFKDGEAHASAKFDTVSIHSATKTSKKSQRIRRGDKPIHPESILNFLKKNCAAGQVKLLSDTDVANIDWKAPIKCSNF